MNEIIVVSRVPWRIRRRTSSTGIPELSQISDAVCVRLWGLIPRRLTLAARR